MNTHLLTRDLQEKTSCEIRFDAISQTVYSTDASIYEVKPLGIVLPKTRQDLIAAIGLILRHGYSITPRGAATGITGGCLGEGVIIDTSKYLHQIIEINTAEQFVAVEPGVIQDQLNAALLPLGYRLGPDTSTGDRATLGGMAANNAAGARSLIFGKMSDAILELKAVVGTGEELHFKSLTEKEWMEKLQLSGVEGHIYRVCQEIRDIDKDEIKRHFPNIPRRVSGYNLDELIKPFPINLAKVLIGSEGSLGIFSELKLKIVPIPKHTGLCVISFASLSDAFSAVEPLLSFHPMSLELIDDQIIKAGKKAPSLKGKLDWLNGLANFLLIIELQSDSLESLLIKLESFQNALKTSNLGTASKVITHSATIKTVWELRKAGLGLLLSKRSYSRAIAFIEDLSIPTHHLASFASQFLSYLHSKGKTAGIYGHAGAGCLHIRPYIDLRDPHEVLLAKQMMLDLAQLVLQLGGAMSGEHGDGLIRSWLNEKIFGSKLYNAFNHLKASFDPLFLLNPGKIISTTLFEENLRLVADKKVDSFFTFQREGGLALTADLCNGNGFCRKQEGVMCPSFQVTKDEYDTTRARATTLRNLLAKNESLANEDFHNILDLCVQCKGCKTECPSLVDMAKIKSEALFHYQEQNGYSLRSHLFAYLADLLYLASFLPSVANFFNRLPLIKKIFGIAKERTLPHIAPRPFSFTTTAQSSDKEQVVLFIDTYTQFIHPHLGDAAIEILNFLDYHVEVVPWQCCGRPLISKGYLKEAKEKAYPLIQKLLPYAEKGNPIIGLEPSCLLSFQDEYLDFFPTASLLASKAILFDSFVANHLKEGKKPLSLPIHPLTISIHTHCHQKALIKTKDTRALLAYFPNVKVKEWETGCCGMAGSFGYESEHFKFSTQIAQHSLIPHVEKIAETEVIVANGFSCRSQIKDLTGKQAYHIAEVLKKYFL